MTTQKHTKQQSPKQRLNRFPCPKIINKDNLSYFGEKNQEKRTGEKLQCKNKPILEKSIHYTF